MMIIKFLVKLVAKVLVLPVILLLGFIILTYNTVEGVARFILGILNIIIVVGVIAAYCNTGSLDLVKQGLIFFAIESVVLGVPQLFASGVRNLHERLQMFLWAW